MKVLPRLKDILDCSEWRKKALLEHNDFNEKFVFLITAGEISCPIGFKRRTKHQNCMSLHLNYANRKGVKYGGKVVLFSFFSTVQKEQNRRIPGAEDRATVLPKDD